MANDGRTADGPAAISLRVNGQEREVVTRPSMPLLWVLRDELGDTGAKYGCGVQQCGSCRVLIDGGLAFSCGVSIGDVEGHEVTTVRGLRDDVWTQVIERAFLKHNAGQCGYCLPGIVVTLVHLARRRSNPDEAELLRALDSHLCRCGAQPRILRAAREALARP